MKLEQNQTWKTPDGIFLRIVQLERLEVQYKEFTDLKAGLGKHHHVSKKTFCRLVKGAELLTPDQVRELARA